MTLENSLQASPQSYELHAQVMSPLLPHPLLQLVPSPLSRGSHLC
jgi:hypothetical protein